MEEDHLVFRFGIDYGGELKYCEAVMKEGSYDVLFNSKWIASVEHTDTWEWIQASGAILPQEKLIRWL